MEWVVKHTILCMAIILFVMGMPAQAAENTRVVQESGPKSGPKSSPKSTLAPSLFVLFQWLLRTQAENPRQTGNDTNTPLHPEDQRVLDILQAADNAPFVIGRKKNGRRISLYIYSEEGKPNFCLPKEVTRLPKLTSLEITGVTYTEPLPETLFSMANLETLYLGDYTWPLPEDISGLQSLKKLAFVDGFFEKLPESLGSLHFLNALYIDNCTLTSLPESLGNLENLELLAIRKTPVHQLPLSTVNLSSLHTLIVENARLTTLPQDIGKLEKLTDASFAGNALRELPPDIQNCRQLRALDVGFNKLTGRVYTTLADLPALKRLNLSGNTLSGPLPEALFAMPYLEYLNLSANNFSGTLPNSLLDAPKLRVLILSANPKLHGQMPPLLSRKKLDVLAIFATSLQYAPEDKDTKQRIPEKTKASPPQTPALFAGFSFTPEKIPFFLDVQASSLQIYSNHTQLPLWGENISLGISFFFPSETRKTPENVQAILAEYTPAIEQTIQNLTTLSKQEVQQAFVDSCWEVVEKFNPYGTLEDMGSYPIHTQADFLQYLRIQSAIMFVEEKGPLLTSICLEEDEALIDGYPLCINTKNGKLE